MFSPGKPGKMVIANMGRLTIFSPDDGARYHHYSHHLRYLKPNSQDVVFLLLETLMLRAQERINLARRYVEAHSNSISLNSG